MDVFFTTTLIFGTYAASRKTYIAIIAASLALPMLVSIWLNRFVDIPFLIFVGDCFVIAFLVFLIVVILSFIFNEREVTINVIYASIVVYLLIAIMWAFVYSVVESIHPGSFATGQAQIEAGRRLYIYYSFVTITTLGYGDITPTTDLANTFSFLEAVTGQLYIAILIARLVGIHIAQSMSREKQIK
ncbi:kef-type K+ transport systems, predicted NAD-binding component [Candidatus Scalindua japonica]|uniref:Kef-type K+ transport systems, predicted NAD-binding component n=1 Tax=Candidatus Scalindua japonica TaxID=1284222 RepID=A0A286U1B6_9BACT|nr:potassium channel family protein [Candidatus Scalindua japonica]GAX61929.1 kef-type K+ transport systems, predicted NAD-binding component [Candidatus Scalindua japonica]